MLHFYDATTNNVYKTVNPILNNLTIFKIKNVENTDHFVSMNVGKYPRLAFTGWFSGKTDL
jgi:Rps23 Pro-64 3,4-dihydroxylase Tpa1-like proline 4-hydroxylase